MMNPRAVFLVLGLSTAPALAQAPPPIPILPDSNRTVTYSISSSTPQVQVPFAVYGDCSDIQVTINNVFVPLPTSLWNCASQSGLPINTLPLPITDMVVNFTPALTSGPVTIAGAWHPRNLTIPTAPGISRREYEQAVNTIMAGERELYAEIAALQISTGNPPILPLSVANGGNGTSTPALTAGSNISITGSWPNYTISSGTFLNGTLNSVMGGI